MTKKIPLENFTNLYSLSKTLRFELIPQGKTLEHIKKNGLLAQDSQRAESYQKVKKIIDEYHKVFIGKSLTDCTLTKDVLEEYFLYYTIKQRDESQKKKFENLQGKLRKEIAERFSKQDSYKRIFGKELIKEVSSTSNLYFS